MRQMTTLATVSVAALTLAACGGSTTEPTAGISVGGADESAPSTEEPQSAGGDGAALFGTAADQGGPYGELRDGVWGAGPAGEVEFAVTSEGVLELVDIREADGWQVTDQQADPDEIEVDFRQGPVELEIEVQLQGGVLEIEIDQDIEPAEPGTFEVGEAASVTLDVDGSALTLGDVVVTDGWTETGRSVSGDEVELDFRRDQDGFFETWELDASLDAGELEVEIDYEIEGVFGR